MRNNKSIQGKQSKKNNKCKIKCRTCQFYIPEDDYCTEREIEYCTKQTQTDFSKCKDYIIHEKLVMF